MGLFGAIFPAAGALIGNPTQSSSAVEAVETTTAYKKSNVVGQGCHSIWVEDG